MSQLYLDDIRIRQVILDVDGTISNLISTLEHKMIITAATYGLPEESVRNDFALIRSGQRSDAGNAHAGFRRMFPDVTDEKLEEFVAYFHHLERTMPYPEVPESKATIQWLMSHGIALSLCTAAHHATLSVRLPALGVELNWFDECRTWEDTPRKPDPRTLDVIFQKTNIPSHETLHIGDSLTDFHAAQEVYFIAVYQYGLTRPEKFEEAGVPRHRILCRLADITNVLEIR
ncbi:MAG: HAD hydrolase-like protein [bacterium]|nr:HAD hydrolase-like protein [bacterium]